LGGELFDICYDGNLIGTFQNESIATHIHNFGHGLPFNGHVWGVVGTNFIMLSGYDGGNPFTGTNPVGININYGVETKPVSISVLPCISY
jgi:hypothetical protein